MSKVFFIVDDQCVSVEMINKMKISYPEIFDRFHEHRFIFTKDIFDTDLAENDRLVVPDDTQYTILSLAFVCEKTKLPIIVIQNNEIHEVVIHASNG